MHERIAYAVTVAAVAAAFLVFRPADDGIVSAAVAEPPLFSAPDVTPVSDLAPSSGEHTIHRNLFAFDEPAPRVEVAPVATRAVEVTPPPAIVAAPADVAPAVPQPPSFDFRYIGRFGTDADPIAAFARNGEIVNARRGETIDGRFVVRAIGIESVDLGFVDFPSADAKRVKMGE